MGKGVIDRIMAYVREHPGKSLGTFLGFLFGVALITLGFWKTLVLGLATWLGYAIGKWSDDEGKGLKEFLEEKLPGRPDFH
ncbi:MAG TPA: DUF2273 domain-containing protein [Firmicutes bacterium]|uniref:DUF2273 domain-containing protein n=1 Tax=Candidatus Fermentithermobacillus carboniphilus TaxID=3085328 RepID=A0AAT9LFJ4_9FIRM|nr:MAG: DUF2273 domain-containing protein [Candidatus Fermentithermobacillus carboniphilus]HHW17923.1 DUF2273 domain-containing protein [Candidatus Fermentithermobacillaceae bacterium]